MRLDADQARAIFNWNVANGRVTQLPMSNGRSIQEVIHDYLMHIVTDHGDGLLECKGLSNLTWLVDCNGRAIRIRVKDDA